MRRRTSPAAVAQPYPSAVKVVELPCTGRIDIVNVLHAFENGADGVLVAGCLEGKCHYLKGNLHAKRGSDTSRNCSDEIGLEHDRARMIKSRRPWASSSPNSPASMSRR